ncbi:MAG: rhodanese-like domain-containing protein [Wenzhouxiangella sp.]
MERILEFIGNHPILTGAFAVVVLAWIIYEVSRAARKWHEIGTLEAVRLINREDPVILDVSNSSDFAKGHIHGARHMPPSSIESGNQQLLKLSDRPVLVYCRNGQVSPQMATRLTGLGFDKVYLLSGGLAQWTSDQQPVTRAKAGGKDKKKGKPSKKDKAAEKAE